MKKKKHHPEGRGITPQGAELVLQRVARQNGTTPEMVRKHIQLAMLNGLVSDDPKIKAFYSQMPKAGEVPTPEEVIAFISQKIADE